MYSFTKSIFNFRNVEVLYTTCIVIMIIITIYEYWIKQSRHTKFIVSSYKATNEIFDYYDKFLNTL